MHICDLNDMSDGQTLEGRTFSPGFFQFTYMWWLGSYDYGYGHGHGYYNEVMTTTALWLINLRV